MIKLRWPSKTGPGPMCFTWCRQGRAESHRQLGDISKVVGELDREGIGAPSENLPGHTILIQSAGEPREITITNFFEDPHAVRTRKNAGIPILLGLEVARRKSRFALSCVTERHLQRFSQEEQAALARCCRAGADVQDDVPLDGHASGEPKVLACNFGEAKKDIKHVLNVQCQPCE